MRVLGALSRGVMSQDHSLLVESNSKDCLFTHVWMNVLDFISITLQFTVNCFLLNFIKVHNNSSSLFYMEIVNS